MYNYSCLLLVFFSLNKVQLSYITYKSWSYRQQDLLRQTYAQEE